MKSLMQLAQAALQKAFELRCEALAPECLVPTPVDQHTLCVEDIRDFSRKRRRLL